MPRWLPGQCRSLTKASFAACRWLRRIQTEPEAQALFRRFGSSHLPRAVVPAPRRRCCRPAAAGEGEPAGAAAERPAAANNRSSDSPPSIDRRGRPDTAQGQKREPQGGANAADGSGGGGGVVAGSKKKASTPTSSGGGAIVPQEGITSTARVAVPQQARKGAGAAGGTEPAAFAVALLLTAAAAGARAGRSAPSDVPLLGGAASLKVDDWTAIEVVALRWRVTLHGEGNWDAFREDFRLRNRCAPPALYSLDRAGCRATVPRSKPRQLPLLPWSSLSITSCPPP